MVVLDKNDLRLVKIMKSVERRPGMFINPLTISSLNNFMSGLKTRGLFSDSQEDIFSRLEPSLYDYIAESEGEKNLPGHSWADVLEEKYPSEKEALTRFFAHLNNFLTHHELER
jgi:hypothetical protein